MREGRRKGKRLMRRRRRRKRRRWRRVRGGRREREGEVRGIELFEGNWNDFDEGSQELLLGKL